MRKTEEIENTIQEEIESNMEFKNIIRHYLDSDKIPYALLLNAEWGEGKTWYIKNQFEVDFKKKKILYVSLNGETSIDSIAESIMLQKIQKKTGIQTGELSKKKKAGINLVKTLGKGFFNRLVKLSDEDTKTLEDSWKTISSDIDAYCSLDEDEILILDDLERCQIELEELFGFIANNFTESNAGKVIIIANEGAIQDKEKYNKLKEKVIWQTVEFKSEFYIIEHINEDPKAIKIDIDIAKFVKEVLEMYEISNKRTILFLLEKIEIFIDKANNIDKDDINLFIHTLIVLGNEYRKGNIVNVKKDDVPVFISDPYYNPYLSLNIDIKSTEIDTINGFKISKNYFQKKYIRNPKQYRFHFSYAMFILAVCGYFDKNLWDKEYEAFKVEKIKPPPAHIDNLNRFITIHNASDEEFNEISKQLFNDIEDSKFDLYNLVRAAYNVELFNSMGIQFEKSYDEIFKLINEKLNLAVQITEYNYNGMRPFSEDSTSKSNEFNNILSRSNDLQKELEKNQIKETLLSIFEGLMNDKFSTDMNTFIQLIENLTPEQLEQISAFYFLSGNNREMIYQYIKNASHSEEKFKSDQQFFINLKLIIDAIEEKLTRETRASAYGLNELKNIIAQIRR